MGNSCTKGCVSKEEELDEADDLSAPLLHGLLKVHVIEAKDLPDTDNLFYNISRGDVSDPFVELCIESSSLLKTAVKKNCLNPHWDEKFTVPLCHNALFFVAYVRDREHIGAETIGHFTIPTDIVSGGDPVVGWYDVQVGPNKQIQGSVHIWMQFSPVGGNVDARKYMYNSYFPPQMNNKVTLYQDADTPNLAIFNGLTNPDGSAYDPTRCWRDVFDAVNQAERLIYITGWSVFTGISLLRGEEQTTNEDSNIGEMLKKKASQGVRVLVMTWNETDLFDGFMGTHDEDTKAFFEGTDVICANVAREKDSWLGLGGTFVSTCYTHHQKTVITDVPGDNEKRRLIAFVGGLDITDGRYDTPEFNLFKTIKTCHAGDFYSKCLPGATVNIGPRQPWHDIHAKVEGPTAFDVCQNFMERWRKQNKPQEAYLLPLDDFDSESFGPYRDEDGGPWVSQIFRSITSDSAIFSPSRYGNLFRKYGRYIENSIVNAYVEIIRGAQNYIYIENQYFLGSAFSWYRDKSTQSNHIVPREITQKIIEKIKQQENFKVYICIPMYPEGDPVSDASQEILYWQYCTFESMYKKIAKALSKQNSDKHPTDYLNVYCLGKRESEDEVPYYMEVPATGTPAEKLRKSLRHPIYVHSKLLISDDDYIIVGSANINERSLGGNRDTEICIGAFQPNHTMESGNTKGAIHTFRKALWSAHLGGYDAAIDDPSSSACLQYVRQTTDKYWQAYTQPDPVHCDTHLLPYPFKVLQSGKIKAKAEPWNTFPDTAAPVLGKKSGYLPAKLTT